MKTALLLASASVALALGCNTETASSVVVDNDYPVVSDGGFPMTETTVFKVWWSTTLLPDAILPGQEGQPERTVSNSDFAYAVLAPGWDPSSSSAPSKFIVAKSATKLDLARGAQLHVRVSDATFVGNCGAGKVLSQSDADFITSSIFPAEFAGTAYNAETCLAVPIADAGAAAAEVEGGADRAAADLDATVTGAE